MPFCRYLLAAKWSIAIMLAILLSFGTNQAYANSTASLRWGADANSGAPYVFADPADLSHRIGFEEDIVNAIAQDMHLTPIFVQNNWDSLIPGLQRGLYDVAINGLEITPEHQAVVDFSIPYYTTFEQLVVQRQNARITSLHDLAGLRVGTLKASLAQRILQNYGKADIKTYDVAINAYTDLENGRLDAVLMDAPIAIYYAAPRHDLKFVSGQIGVIQYGIAVAKGNPKLVSQLNAAIEDIIRSGQLHSILQRWNLWNDMTAAQTGDHTTSATPPTSYTAFIQATGTAANHNSKLARYIGFLPLLGRGALMTLEISVLGMAIAVSLGLVLALCRGYMPFPLKTLAGCYVECIRGTPLLIQILFIFYALPDIGVKLDPFLAGMLALGLNYAAYEAENYRAGLQAIPKGQMEAATALNMTKIQSLRYIIVPQAVRIVIPTITNDFISLLKDSSLVSVITMVELTQVYMQLSTTYYDYLVPGIMVACTYLLMGFPFILLARWTERHLAVELDHPMARKRIAPGPGPH
jgi:polar amino acid transport system substrate-binding protein